jgi:hypothetical protein
MKILREVVGAKGVKGKQLGWENAPQGLNRLRKNPRSGKKDVPQGLKADVFSIVYGPTKVVP